MKADQSVQNKPSVDVALSTFAKAGAMEQKNGGLRELMKGGAIYSVQDDPRFSKGVKDAIKKIHSSDNSEEKLLALALVARVSGRIGARRADLEREVESALRTSPPKLSLLKDADDRTYAAQTLQQGSGGWVVPYIAQSIVEEEAGEKARYQLVCILLEKTSELAGAFDALGKAFAEWKPKTEEPGDSAGRRLKRVLSAVRRRIVLTETSPGDAAGKFVDRLVYGAIRNSGPPRSPSVSTEVVIEVVALLHDLVRMHASLARDGATYKVVGRLSRWFAGRGWPDSARSQLRLLSRDVEEAMTLLAKEGKSDNELLDALTTVEGSRAGALKITSRIARNVSGLSGELVEWLRRGRVTGKRAELDLLIESNRLSTDPALARLLVDSQRLVRMLDSAGQDILNDVRVFSPNYSEGFASLLSRAKALAEGVGLLSRTRNLRLRGRPGDVVEYSPIEHEGESGVMVGVRRVRIVSPMVERARGDGVREIVIRATVEPM